MKKLLNFAINRISSNNLTKTALTSLLALCLGAAFCLTTQRVAATEFGSEITSQEIAEDIAAKPGKGGSKPGKDVPSGKCDVCHNPHNYHTISIPCDQVDKFLSNHPGDFRGKCEVTGVTNP